MAEHYKTLSAVFPVIFRIENDIKQVLLAKRANTGYMDGLWDFAGSGHVDADETAKEAVVREAYEEIGIAIDINDVEFAHLCHKVGKNANKSYYDIYFKINNFKEVPIIAEPEKCSDLKWFDITSLPSDMIVFRKNVLLDFLNNNNHYSELFV